LVELGRTSAGSLLADWPTGSVLVDGPDNGFLGAFAAWPVRFFVLREETGGVGTGDGKVMLEFKAQPHENDCSYHLDDLVEWLEKSV
jgi:hypothetical protein